MQVWTSAITRVNGSDTMQGFLAINVCLPPDPPPPPPKKERNNIFLRYCDDEIMVYRVDWPSLGDRDHGNGESKLLLPLE